jgi:hypothetical protein
MDERTASLVRECIRQFDNCRYTATALFTWEKRARVWRGMFLVAPIILGGFASSQLLVATGVYGKLIGALCGLLAGFCPAIFKALNLDLHLAGICGIASGGLPPSRRMPASMSSKRNSKR